MRQRRQADRHPLSAGRQKAAIPAVRHPTHNEAVLAVPEAPAEAEAAVFRFKVALGVPAALTAKMVEPDMAL